MKRDCHFVAVEIEKLCRRFEIRLETFWILRESRQIEYCDVWSKEVVELDYCMSKVCSRDLWDKFGLFYADYFASDRIYRMKAFFARFASGESEGVDVFGVSWKEGSGLFHPPEGLISRVVRKVEKERAKGVLVAPDGLGSSRLAMVEEKVRMRKWILVNNVSLVLECPLEIVSNTFRGGLNLMSKYRCLIFKEDKGFLGLVLMWFCSMLRMRVDSFVRWTDPEKFVDLFLAGRFKRTFPMYGMVGQRLGSSLSGGQIWILLDTLCC